MGLGDSAINIIAERAKAKINPGDYEKDGILYCGNCNTPKQCMKTFNGINRIFGCMCLCEQSQYEEEKKLDEEKQKKIYIDQLRVNGIQDTALRSYRFDSCEMTPLLKSCKKYVERWDEVLKGNHGLILWGDVESGKTFATACIANALIDRGVPVLMTSFPRILSINFNDRAEWLEEMVRFPLLLIDDFGVERSTEYSLETMYYVLDERYKSGKPLIVTTNLTLQEIENPTSTEYKRIFSRLREMCQPVRVTGRKWRKQKTEEKRENFMEIFKNA